MGSFNSGVNRRLRRRKGPTVRWLCTIVDHGSPGIDQGLCYLLGGISIVWLGSRLLGLVEQPVAERSVYSESNTVAPVQLAKRPVTWRPTRPPGHL